MIAPQRLVETFNRPLQNRIQPKILRVIGMLIQFSAVALAVALTFGIVLFSAMSD